MKRIGWVYDEACLQHVSREAHPESPQRLSALREGIERADLNLVRLSCQPADREDILRVHSASHFDLLKRSCAHGLDHVDSDTYIGPGSWGAALAAAGAGVCAAEAVLEGWVDRVFCAVRPPGHHAEANRAMGFCLFNNVAIAARWLREVRQVPRVAILDWDVHHGNGTQQAFYDDATVFYASLHQHPFFPGTGSREKRGVNDTNLNIPLPWRSPPEAWVDALRDEVLPALERFQPDFLLISCGFDGHILDPLASQRLEAAHYEEMTRLACPLAHGRTVSILEGGYHLEALTECALAHLRALGA